MSEVVQTLKTSQDPLERKLAQTLLAWQNAKASKGLGRSLGYEPRDIRDQGAVEVISKRVKGHADGFNQVGAEDSYEAIVCEFPERFDAEIRTIAQERMRDERERFAPTADREKCAELVAELLQRTTIGIPKGQKIPQKLSANVTQYCRDPKVQAYIKWQSRGNCELCDRRAPFKDQSGSPYLEVHHVKPLACGGSDRISNAVALCPNCHRAVHFAENSQELSDRLFEKLSRLVKE